MFELAVKTILPQLPTSDEAVVASLAAVGLKGWDLRWVEQAARFFRRHLPFAVLWQQGRAAALRTDSLTGALEIRDGAVRAVSAQGLASARMLGFRGAAAARADDILVRTLPGFQWLDEGVEWFWYGERGSPVTRAIAQRLRTQAGFTYVDARAILLSRAQPLFPPPGPVMRTLLAQLARPIDLE